VWNCTQTGNVPHSRDEESSCRSVDDDHSIHGKDDHCIEDEDNRCSGHEDDRCIEDDDDHGSGHEYEAKYEAWLADDDDCWSEYDEDSDSESLDPYDRDFVDTFNSLVNKGADNKEEALKRCETVWTCNNLTACSPLTCTEPHHKSNYNKMSLSEVRH